MTGSSGPQWRVHLGQWLFVAVCLLVLLVVVASCSSRTPSEYLPIGYIVTWTLAGSFFALGYLSARFQIRPRIDDWLFWTPLLACIGVEFSVSGLTGWCLAGSLILVLLRPRTVWPSLGIRTSYLLLGIYFALALLPTMREPLPRFDIARSASYPIYIAAISGMIAVLPLWRLARCFRNGSIRDRLLIGSIISVLLPTTVVGGVSAAVGLRHGRQQLLNQLESVVTLKEAEIDTWVNDVQIGLDMVLFGSDTARDLRDVLLEPDSSNSRIAYNHLLERFLEIVRETPQYEELFLMDTQGRAVLSTSPTQQGQSHSLQPYFRMGLIDFYIHPPVYSPAMGLVSVVAATPILDKGGQGIGVLAGRVNPEKLSTIMNERAGLGQTGESYLVDRHHTLVTGSRLRMQEFTDAYFVFSWGSNAAIDRQEAGSGAYVNYRGADVIGVYRWLPQLQVGLLAEQQQAEAFRDMYATIGINAAVTAVALVVAALGSLLITGRISRRLSNLAETATRIASGDLQHFADVRRPDEIGALANAFNSMTDQLRDLINSLEQRVQDRTAAVRRHALQLETSARLSREITSILNIDGLLTRIVDLIRDTFGYYHVQILLVDDSGHELILRAATGETGRAQKSEGYRMPIGIGSLNGEAAEFNAAIMSGDVSIEPRFLPDPLLPHTRSELVIPLHIGGRVIGTLDVQSSDLNGFGAEDVLVIQSLGDQLAIAIENARLYQRTRELAVLEERNRLARELHDSVAQSLFSLDLHARAVATYLRRDPGKAEAQIKQIRQIAQESLQEMRRLIHALRPGTLEDMGLVSGLRYITKRECKQGGPEFSIEVKGERRLPPDVELGLFRIAQEAIRNAIAHANATLVGIELMFETEAVTLHVTDDGRGFDPQLLPADGRFGLLGMRERASSLNGTCTITTSPGVGTLVEVRVPA